MNEAELQIKLILDRLRELGQLARGLDNVEKETRDLGRQAAVTNRRMASFNKGLDRARSAARTLRTGLIAAVAIIGATAGAVVALTRNVAAYTDELAKAEIRTGVSTEQLSFLRFAAERNDAAFGTLVTGIRNANRAIDELRQGSGEAGEALGRLGFSAGEFSGEGGKDLNDILPTIIERMNGIEDQALKTDIALNLFGRAGLQLLPTLQDMGDNAEFLRERFDRFGIEVDQFSADAGVRLTDLLDTDLRLAFLGLRLELAEQLIPAVIVITEKVIDLVVRLRETQEESDAVTSSLENMGLVAIQIGGIFQALFNIVGIAFQGLVGIVGSALAGTGTFIEGVAGGVQKVAGLLSILPGAAGDIGSRLAAAAGNAREFGAALTNAGLDTVIGAYDQIRVNVEDLGNAWDLISNPQGVLNNFNDEVAQTVDEIREASNKTREYTNVLEGQTEGTEEDTESTKENAEAQEELAEKLALVVQARQDLAQEIVGELENLTTERQALEIAIDQNIDLADAKLALRAANLGIAESFGEVLDIIIEEREAVEDLQEVYQELNSDTEELADTSEDTFNAITDFATDTVNEIRNLFADLFGNILRGDFDSFADFADSTFQAITNSLGQALSGSIFQAFTPGGGGFGNILSGITSLFGLGGPQPGLGFDISGLPGVGAGAIPSIGPGLGGFLSAGAVGFGIGSTIGGFFGDNDLTEGIGAGIGAVAGGGVGSIFGPIGTAIGSGIGSLLGDVIGGFFGSDPRFDLEVFGVGNEQEAQNLGRTVADVLRLRTDAAFREAEIFISERGDIADRSAIREGVAAALGGTIDAIQGIISTLPSELASTLNELLLDTELNIRQLEDDVALEFDESRSQAANVGEALQQFLNGEIQARFLTTIDSFFVGAFEALGVTSGAAQDLVEQRLNQIGQTEGRDARAQLGAAFLEDFNSFVQLFNLATNEASDLIQNGIDTVLGVANGLGFSAIPSLEAIQARAQQLIENINTAADFEAAIGAAQQLQELRGAIIQLRQAVITSIGGLTQLVNAMAGLGATGISATGALTQTADALVDLINNGGLSLEEQEAILGQLGGIVQNLANAEQQAASEAQAAAAEAARSRVQAQIEALNDLRARELEIIELRLDALNEELTIVQGLESLSEDISRNIFDLQTGPQSIDGIFARISTIQNETANLTEQLQNATGGEREEIGRRIQELLNQALGLQGQAFGQPSLEFRDGFRDTIAQLEDLQALIEPSRSSEAILQDIQELEEERNILNTNIDRRIEILNEQLNNIGNSQIGATNGVSAEVRRLAQFVQEQANEILEDRLAQLAELSGAGVATEIQGFNSMIGIGNQTNELLQVIAVNTGGPREIQNAGARPLTPEQLIALGGGNSPAALNNGGIITRPGIGIIPETGQLFTIAENGPEQVGGVGGGGGVTIPIQIGGNIVTENELIERVTEGVIDATRFDAELKRRLQRALES